MSKIPNFEMFNFEKQRPVSDAECPQKSNGTIRFSVRGLEPPKNYVSMYDVTIRRYVVDIAPNFSFWGQKSMYRFEILYCGGCWLDV